MIMLYTLDDKKVSLCFGYNSVTTSSLIFSRPY